jgi:hypothetical protein
MKYVLAISALLFVGSTFAQQAGSKLYILPTAPEKTLEDGTKVVTTSGGSFNFALEAEFAKDGVPLVLTTDSRQADYTLRWGLNQEPHYGGFDVYTASVSIVDKNNQIIWTAVATKRTQHDCADAIAKQLKNTMKHKKP